MVNTLKIEAVYSEGVFKPFEKLMRIPVESFHPFRLMVSADSV